ncbi:rho GTPase-activating protein 45 isoform X1 [Anguilla anguilla]|uniref:rho GTPase-activating protein 45 isoform X1 n=2 Tax=Anguilla anguilla TaxID=7936 RepID=UPI0015AE9C36|nr:rho GTPase-activating protein 45 isoform X1 [Anguilla anguilla]
MLKRGACGKSSYSPYATGHRVKKNGTKAKSKLDLLPNKPNIWLKQLSVLQEQPSRDAVDAAAAAASCSSSPPSSSGLLDPFSFPGGPSGQPGRPGGCPSPVATLRRPTALSRHASAAGFPLQSWVYNKGLGRGAATAPSPTAESPEPAAIEVEDIPALLHDVARFAEAVEKLKDVVLGEDTQENRRPVAHECLGEVLRILRQVISTYPLLNTMETLTAAGKLISMVKGFHYEANNDADKKAFEKAIETIAVAFSSSVSELLMGEVDSSTLLSLLPSEKSRSMENLHGGVAGQGPDCTLMKDDLQGFVLSAEEVDVILQGSEGGVDSALSYAKTIAKYMKDLTSYVEKRIALETEFAKGLTRLYHTCKQSIAQPHMPFLSIYCLALEQDLEQSLGVQQAASTLHNQTFLQPLTQRRLEHEKKRKEIKEQWQREKRKLLDAESNLRKARQFYVTRCEEYDKAKSVTSRAEEDGGSSVTKSLDKKRRLEEEARGKAEEAEATYRTCIADAVTQQQEQEHVKVNVLRQIQEVIKQSDQTLRSATISYNQIMHMQTVALPVHYQTLCESSKLYDLGQQYAAHVKDLRLPEEPKARYKFEPYSASSAQQSGRVRHDSFNTDRQSAAEAPPTSGEAASGDGVSSHKQRKVRGHQSHKSWPTTQSDTESAGGGSGLESPSTSTGDVRKIPRTSSTGTMSSNEDLEEKDGNVASFEQSMNGIEPENTAPSGPFRNIGLSKAAQTHRLRKLRTPAKCRECNSYVYFQGAECEECFLACHKKCLETLAIQCGHKKLQGRLLLFGRDFSQAAQGSTEGIPFIIKKCILEIERRALKMKGIYRVNGVKTRVEKLCQAFENGKELVELSQASPHDISNMLKLYLRQLPEPIMPFQHYHTLMGLAKDSLKAETPEGEGAGKGPELVDRGPETDPEVRVLVDKLRELLKELPWANVVTLHYIVCHLRRIAELEEDNKMSPSNLGIVFGPTLMRPRPTGATVSLSSLVDYPHQARIVEALIVFYHDIFPPEAGSLSQDNSVAGRREEGDGQEASERRGRPDAEDRLEELCGTSPGSSGSRERSVDSDSELEEAEGEAQQESEASADDEQLSPRGSVDFPDSPDDGPPAVPDGGPPAVPDGGPPAVPDGGPPAVPDGGPPAVPDGEPPDADGAEQELELASSLAQLNTNQSNNTAVAPLGLPLARLCKGRLAVAKDARREPEFV